jgi:hypothetical protein
MALQAPPHYYQNWHGDLPESQAASDCSKMNVQEPGMV